MKPNNDFYEKIGISRDLLEGMDDVFETMKQEDLDQIVKIVDLNEQRDNMAAIGQNTEDVSKEITSLFNDIKAKTQRIPTFEETDMEKSEYMKALSDTRKSWREVRDESHNKMVELTYNNYELTLSAKDLKERADETAAYLGKLENNIKILSENPSISDQERETLELLKKEYESTKETLKEQTDAYLEEKNRLAQNNKELLVATLVNNCARTNISQTLAMQREEFLAPAREKLEQAQQDLKKNMRDFGHDVQTLGSQLKTHLVIGRKISDLNFTPLRDFKEKVTNREIRRQYKHINKAKKAEMKIEKKALRKFNREAKKEFKAKVRRNNIDKLLGKELSNPEIKGQQFQKTQDFKDLTPEQQDKAVDSLNKFRKGQLKIIQKDIEYRQGRIAKSLDRAAEQRRSRNLNVSKVREKFKERAEITFDKDLKKFQRGLDKAEYNINSQTAAALKDMVERGQIDIGKLTQEAKDLLEDITGVEIGEGQEINQFEHSGGEEVVNEQETNEQETDYELQHASGEVANEQTFNYSNEVYNLDPNKTVNDLEVGDPEQSEMDFDTPEIGDR